MTFDELNSKIKSYSAKDVFELIYKIGFCKEYNGSYFTERTEMQYMILDFVKETSKGFQSDIADKAYNYRISEKQAWCIAFEFQKLKDSYDSFINKNNN